MGVVHSMDEQQVERISKALKDSSAAIQGINNKFDLVDDHWRALQGFNDKINGRVENTLISFQRLDDTINAKVSMALQTVNSATDDLTAVVTHMVNMLQEFDVGREVNQLPKAVIPLMIPLIILMIELAVANAYLGILLTRVPDVSDTYSSHLLSNAGTVMGGLTISLLWLVCFRGWLSCKTRRWGRSASRTSRAADLSAPRPTAEVQEPLSASAEAVDVGLRDEAGVHIVQPQLLRQLSPADSSAASEDTSRALSRQAPARGVPPLFSSEKERTTLSKQRTLDLDEATRHVLLAELARRNQPEFDEVDVELRTSTSSTSGLAGEMLARKSARRIPASPLRAVDSPLQANSPLRAIDSPLWRGAAVSRSMSQAHSSRSGLPPWSSGESAQEASMVVAENFEKRPQSPLGTWTPMVMPPAAGDSPVPSPAAGDPPGPSQAAAPAEVAGGGATWSAPGKPRKRVEITLTGLLSADALWRTGVNAASAPVSPLAIGPGEHSGLGTGEPFGEAGAQRAAGPAGLGARDRRAEGAPSAAAAPRGQDRVFGVQPLDAGVFDEGAHEARSSSPTAGRGIQALFQAPPGS